MQSFRILSFFLLSLWLAASAATAQNSDKPSVPKRPAVKPLPTELKDFFIGEWTGAGEFASGKKIEADVRFSAELDEQWLAYRHADRAPNRYKASGMWGFDRDSEKFVMLVNDNFGGARLFIGDGWRDGKVVFTRAPMLSGSNFQERFTFEKQSPDSFRMTYENSPDGKTWKLGDFLVFKRKGV